MGWFVRGFGVVEQPRSAGPMLEREFMGPCGCLPANSCQRRARDACLTFFLRQWRALAAYPIWDFAWGFPAPKRVTTLVVNRPPVHTSHRVNHCIRVRLGFLGPWQQHHTPTLMVGIFCSKNKLDCLAFHTNPPETVRRNWEEILRLTWI